MATCPICKSSAEEIEPGFDGKTLRCPRHGEFEVADTVFRVVDLMNADTRKWETALEAAAKKARPGARPRILTYDFSENTLRQGPLVSAASLKRKEPSGLRLTPERCREYAKGCRDAARTEHVFDKRKGLEDMAAMWEDLSEELTGRR
jgi:hypothetical protein